MKHFDVTYLKGTSCTVTVDKARKLGVLMFYVKGEPVFSVTADTGSMVKLAEELVDAVETIRG